MDRFDLHEDEDGEREKEKDGNRTVNKQRKWYLALKGIKGNYAPSAKEEIPLIRGEYGWLEHTQKTTLEAAQEASHRAYAGNAKAPTQEDIDDDELAEINLP